MKFFKEFKEFALKGNVIDLAVGVIIGAAFKSIVDSLTNDIISPILGLFGGVDFTKFEWVLKETVNENGEKIVNSIKYGSFITAVINFIIMAFIIFLIVKGINSLHEVEERLKKLKGGDAPEEAPEAPTTKICPFCKSEIPVDATRCPHCTSELE